MAWKPNIFGSRPQEDRDTTAEESTYKLIAAQAKLQTQLGRFKSTVSGPQDRADLDKQLQKIVERDRTGLAKNLYGSENDRRNGRIVENYDTNWLIDGAEDLSAIELDQRVWAADAMTKAVVGRLPEINQTRGNIPVGKTLENNRTQKLPDAREPRVEGQTELDRQAAALLKDPQGRKLVDQTKNAIRTTVEANPDASPADVSQMLLNDKSPKNSAAYQAYERSQAFARSQANVARSQAVKGLTDTGNVGITNQQRAIFNRTLVDVNHTGLTQPGLLRMSSNGADDMSVNQAVVMRAVEMDLQVGGRFHKETAVTKQAEHQHVGLEDRFEGTVGLMKERAAEISSEPSVARTQARDLGVSTGDLSLARDSIQMPAPPAR